MNIPSSGFPRPVGGFKDPKKNNNTTSSGYQGREMEEKARKEREDKQRKAALWGRDLLSEKAELKAQEAAYAKLRQDITALQNQTRVSVTANSDPILQLQNLDRQNSARISKDEEEIESLEKDLAELDRASESKVNTLISQREQAEEKESEHITEIEKEIQLKEAELKTAEAEDKALQREILELKNKPKVLSDRQNDGKIAEKKKMIEKLKGEISTIKQKFDQQKQQAEKTSRDLAQKESESKKQKLSLDDATQKAILIARRIEDIKHNIGEYEKRIRDLKIAA